MVYERPTRSGLVEKAFVEEKHEPCKSGCFPTASWFLRPYEVLQPPNQKVSELKRVCFLKSTQAIRQRCNFPAGLEPAWDAPTVILLWPYGPLVPGWKKPSRASMNGRPLPDPDFSKCPKTILLGSEANIIEFSYRVMPPSPNICLESRALFKDLSKVLARDLLRIISLDFTFVTMNRISEQ